MFRDHQPTVSIIIKALNEEVHIAAAIESAFAALAGIDGEIILADGGSRDRTIEIAQRYPIRIVQLIKAEDRSCGSGAQLGYQYSEGLYLLLMDGDMRLHADFLPAAIRLLNQKPAVAGVGGAITESEIANEEYEQRNSRHDPDRHPGPVTRLDSSALYRRTAIASIGYLTDRNLHGNEEFDLGARLHARGWILARIDRPAIDHFGHSGSAYRLLLRRMITRNASATGELVRAALGRSHFWFAIRNDHNWFLCLLVTGWWVSLALAAFALKGSWAVLATTALFLLPFAAMSWRWRSVRLALYSVTALNVYALCFWPGLIRVRKPPQEWIESRVLQDSVRHDIQTTPSADVLQPIS
jgi:glycosyltransferase involved in cell wall biosynthesis